MSLDELIEALIELRQRRPSLGTERVRMMIEEADGPGGAPVGDVYGEPTDVDDFYGTVMIRAEKD